MTAILYSNSGDARTTDRLHAELRTVLSDRFSLWGHPAIHYAGNCAQHGTTTIKVPFVSEADFAAVAEGTSVSTTALTLSSVTVTVAGQHLRFDISDLNNLVDSVGLNEQLLVQKMVPAAARRWMAMLCEELDGHTATAGTTAVDFNLDTYLEGRYALMNEGVPGPFMAVLAPEQVTQLIEDVRGEVANGLSMRQDTQDLFASQGQGQVADYLGDTIVQSSYVTTDSGDRKGAIFGYGAYTYADGTVRAVAAGNTVIPAGQQVVVEIERDAAGRLTKVVGSLYTGVKLLEDKRGVTLISKAAA